MFWAWAATFGTILILSLTMHVLGRSRVRVQKLHDAPGIRPPAGDKTRASAPSDVEAAWIRRAIAFTGITMVPVVVVGSLVAGSSGASPFVAAPLVVLVGGLVAKIASYYFPSNE